MLERDLIPSFSNSSSTFFKVFMHHTPIPPSVRLYVAIFFQKELISFFLMFCMKSGEDDSFFGKSLFPQLLEKSAQSYQFLNIFSKVFVLFSLGVNQKKNSYDKLITCASSILGKILFLKL